VSSCVLRGHGAGVAVYSLFHRLVRFSGAETARTKICLSRVVYRGRVVLCRGGLLLFYFDAGGADGVTDVLPMAWVRRVAMAGRGLYQLCLQVHAGHGVGF